MSQRKTKNFHTYLLTGGAGFVGHHVVESLVKNTDADIIIVDSLTYSGSLNRLRDIDIKVDNEVFSVMDTSRVKVITWDLRHEAGDNLAKELKEVTHILHLAAESHVDHSISDPMRFVEANVKGTVNLLQLARKLPNLELFYYFSTDEVFGPAPLVNKTDHPLDPFYVPKRGENGFTELDRLDPKNPYAASKAAAEMFVRAYANTFTLPCVISNTMNVFGERQHPEKFIPLCIRKIQKGETVTIHADPSKRFAGQRTYIHARNVADAMLFLLKEQPWLKYPMREVESYNIVGELEVDNLTLAKFIAEVLGKELKYEMVDFHSSRPGHDLRYALNGSKMAGLGWKPPKTFHQSLQKTITWYLENPEWLEV